MIRHRRRMRYPRSRYTRFIVNAALIAWAGVLLVAIVNKSAENRPGADVITSEITARPPNSDAAESRRRGQGADIATGTRTRSNGRIKPSGTIAQARSSQIPPSALERAESMARGGSDAHVGSANGVATPNAEAGSVATVDQRASLRQSDIAQLETNSELSAEASPGTVARAQFTTGIRGREPINRVEAVFSVNGQVYSLDGRPLSTLYYFTEVTGMGGEAIVHRWEYDGQVVQETSFEIGDDRYRVYSKKVLLPGTEGNWRVVVTDGQGNIMQTDSFFHQGS